MLTSLTTKPYIQWNTFRLSLAYLPLYNTLYPHSTRRIKQTSVPTASSSSWLPPSAGSELRLLQTKALPCLAAGTVAWRTCHRAGLGLATTGLTCCCHQSLAPPRVLQQFAREQKLAPGSCLLERSATPLSYFGKLLSYFESRRFTSDTGAIGSATSEGDRTKCVPGRPFARPPSASAGETEDCRNLLALRRGIKATMVRNASVSAP